MNQPGTTTAADHPRPDARREGAWGLLNGRWDFAPGAPTSRPDAWPYEIVVPFGWETQASGVGLNWLESGWYRLRWAPPIPPAGHRLVVMFGAVQHECRVFVAGQELAHHVGGQTPFEVDITDVLGGTTEEEIELCVAVVNPIDKAATPHGKQRSIPADPYDVCSFTPCSGIWQSVWWQHRPAGFIAGIAVHSRDALDGFDVVVETDGALEMGDAVTVGVSQTSPPARVDAQGRAELIIENPRTWTPDEPYLYQVVAELWRDGSVVDRLTTYSGLRKIEIRGRHLYLNDRRVFLRGVLDQGYWPDHGWTAPSLDQLTADLDAARRLGFNLVRKHLKLEDPRWLHHADTIGMLVWEEPASTSRYSETATRAFADQIRPMITRDRNHPSIIIWGLYNEEWGLDWDVCNDAAKQEILGDAYGLAKGLDPSRLVIDNSGWEHVRTDLVDWHIYAHDQRTWKDDLDWIAAGEDLGFAVDLDHHVERKHLRVAKLRSDPGPRMNSEYGTGRTSVERAWVMRWQTQELRRMAHNNGYVYTELYDIEHETAGLLGFDRSTKDDLGLGPTDSHADTVIIADVLPVTPGCDLRTTSGEASFDIWVSHHGSEVLTGNLIGNWDVVGSRYPGPEAAEMLSSVKVEPFELFGPVPVHAALPEGVGSARLHLAVLDDEGVVVAHSSVDVRLGVSD